MEKLINIIKIIDGKYVLNTDLLHSALTSADDCNAIALISIVGPKSHGKTFFINCLINYMCSEHKDKWPHSEDALIKIGLRPQSYGDNITPVIKLSSSPFIKTDQMENEVIKTAVFLMDSDFVFDNEMSSQQVQDIITLFLLTSSTVIYNNKRFLPIQEFLCLKQISSGISKIDNSLDSLKNIVFLIRDWSLSAEKRNNKWSYGLHEGSKFIKNFIEKMDLSGSYEDLSCFLMSAPGLKTQTKDIKLFELNKQFILDLQNLIEFNLLDIDVMQKKRRPNTNEYIKATELLKLFEDCVKKLNGDTDEFLVDGLNAGIENLIIEDRSRDEIESSKNNTDSEMNASGSVFVKGLNPTTESHSNDSNLKLEKLETFEEKDVNQTEKSNCCEINLIHSTYDNDIISCSSVSDYAEDWFTDFQGDESTSNSVFINGFHQISKSYESDFKSELGRDGKSSFEEKYMNGAENSNSYGIDSLFQNYDNESDSDGIVIISESFMSNDESKKAQEKQNIKYIHIHEDTNDSPNQCMTENNIETKEMTLEKLSKKNNRIYYSIQANEENERRLLCKCQSSTNNCKVLKHSAKKLELSTGKGRYNEEFTELDRIAIGSYGIVCKTRDKKTNKISAIKKIPIYERFEDKVHNETKILSKLKSNFIVKLESVWIEENYLKEDDFKNTINTKINRKLFEKNKTLLLHIQMEFCLMTLKKGMKILNKNLNQKPYEVMTPFGYSIASKLFIEILEGIDYLHKQNVIHRDLKPNNILISDGKNGNFIKIADFGLATIHEFDGQSHTKYKGTNRYVAPEVLSTRKYDTKADIYSLGVIAQQLFNIDINKPVGKESRLENKYSAIFNVIERMLSVKTALRPYSESILTEKKSWALSLYEIENDIPVIIKENIIKFLIHFS